jgi:hypothetical protein
VTACWLVGSSTAAETETIDASDVNVAYSYLVSQTEGSCTATNDPVYLQISFSGWDESNSSAESCTPQETVKMVTAHLLSTQESCISSISEGRRLQTWTTSGTDTDFFAAVKTDEYSSDTAIITALSLAAFGDGSSTSSANAYEIYLRSINNMFKTAVVSIEEVTTTTTTTTTSTDGGGWPWWAWFLLMLLICCLLCIPLIFLLCFGKTKKTTTSAEKRYVMPAPVRVQTRVPMATMQVPMATMTVPIATATVPIATATVPTASLPPGTVPVGSTRSMSRGLPTGSFGPPKVF